VSNEDGELVPAFEPRQVDTARRARLDALLLGDGYAGVIAWSREADPETCEYGPRTVIYKRGEIPDFQ
jgi:hypothetical protein